MPVISPYSDGLPGISYVAADAAGRVLAARRPDDVVYSASTIKLAVLIAAMRMVDAGLISLHQPLTVRERFPSRVPDVPDFSFDEDEADPGMPPAGSTVTVAEALGRMIYASSNAGTNMVLELTGMEAAAEALELCAATSSKLERLISDHAARDAGYTHETTAADLARIMHAIVSGAAAGPGSTRFMLAQLRRQQYPVISAALPVGTDWGSKSGWVDGIHHDVAFVGAPGAAGSYVLAVCTRGYEQQQAVEAIGSVAASVHSFAGGLKTRLPCSAGPGERAPGTARQVRRDGRS